MLSLRLPSVSLTIKKIMALFVAASTNIFRFFNLSSAAEESGIEGLQPELMPKHVALIMDGNGRWAMSRGLSPEHGHRAGMKTLKTVILKCIESIGIKALTVFAFSTENWKRPKVEVDFLMTLIEEFIRVDAEELIQRYDMQFSVIGDRSRLPESLQSAISAAEEAGRANGGLHLVAALSYGGRHDITEAAKKIASKVEDGILRAQDVDESVLAQQLMTNFMEFSDPDLLIRTSGELRVSNFMLWQLAYAELYFSDKLFPDFGGDDFIQAITCFQGRNRRFGQRKK
ncbi:hypothetical protein ACP275_14G212600 [Erythranthe tilingii]